LPLSGVALDFLKASNTLPINLTSQPNFEIRISDFEIL
jgi:hypothetical protein